MESEQSKSIKSLGLVLDAILTSPSNEWITIQWFTQWENANKSLPS